MKTCWCHSATGTVEVESDEDVGNGVEGDVLWEIPSVSVPLGSGGLGFACGIQWAR